MPFHPQGKLADVLLPAGNHALIKAPGDGNCLFRSAGHLLERGVDQLHINIVDHGTLRTELVDWVGENATELDALGYRLRDQLGIHLNHLTLDNLTPLTQAQNDQIDARVDYLAVAPHWGDEACITAIESLYDVVVEVFDDTGAAHNAFGLNHYDSLHAVPGARDRLRLCVRYAGYRPYHYDFFVLDYDEPVDGPDHAAMVFAEVRSGSGSGSQLYYLGPRVPELKLPTISHDDFSYPPKKKLVKLDNLVPLGKSVSVLSAPPAAPVHVCLRNTADDDASQFCSRSFHFDGLGHSDKPIDDYDEGFVVRLIEGDNEALDVPHLERSVLLVEADRRLSVDRLHARLFYRAKNSDTVVCTLELPLKSALEPSGKKTEDGTVLYTFPAAAVLTVKDLHFLNDVASPYQLVVSVDNTFAPESSAWTYFHFPSADAVTELTCPRCEALDAAVQGSLEWIAGRNSFRIAVYNDAGAGHCASALSTLFSLLYMIRQRVPESIVKLKTIHIFGGTAKGLLQARGMLTGMADIQGFAFKFGGTGRPWGRTEFTLGAGCNKAPQLDDAPMKHLKGNAHIQVCPVGHIMEEEYIQFHVKSGVYKTRIVRAAREGERGMLKMWKDRGDYDWTTAGRCSRHDTVEMIEKPFFLPMPRPLASLTKKDCPTLPRMQRAMNDFNDGKTSAVWPIYGFGEQHGSIITPDVNMANLIEVAMEVTASEHGPDKVIILDLSRDPEMEAYNATVGLLADSHPKYAARCLLPPPTTDELGMAKLLDLFEGEKTYNVMLVYVPGMKPKGQFDYVVANAALPAVFEGAGTKSTMQTLGRPFCFLRGYDSPYPEAPGFDEKFRTSLQHACNQVLSLRDGNRDELVAFLLACFAGELTEYFTAIAPLYGVGRPSKLWEALAAFEQERRGVEVEEEPRKLVEKKSSSDDSSSGEAERLD